MLINADADETCRTKGGFVCLSQMAFEYDIEDYVYRAMIGYNSNCV